MGQGWEFLQAVLFFQQTGAIKTCPSPLHILLYRQKTRDPVPSPLILHFFLMDRIWKQSTLVSGARAPTTRRAPRRTNPSSTTVSDIIHGRMTTPLSTHLFDRETSMAAAETTSGGDPRVNAHPIHSTQPVVPAWLNEMKQQTYQSIQYMSAVIEGRA